MDADGRTADGRRTDGGRTADGRRTDGGRTGRSDYNAISALRCNVVEA